METVFKVFKLAVFVFSTLFIFTANSYAVHFNDSALNSTKQMYLFGSSFQIAGLPAVANNDEIGVFDTGGQLVGASFANPDGIYLLTVFGDDPLTAGVDEGAPAGTPLSFKVWDASAGREYGITEVTLINPGVISGPYQVPVIPVTFTVGTYVHLNISTLITYNVTPSSSGNGTISPSTVQTVNHGLTTEFTLTPSANYHILSVTGTCGGNLAGSIYTTNAVTANCTVIANFAIDIRTLTVSRTGIGTVTSDPAGIDCGTDCTETYDYGTVVALTTTTDISSVFAGWSGDADCSDGQVTMNAAKTCIAAFDALPLLGMTEIVSVSSNGTHALYQSANPSISADGRYVAFYSTSTNLVAGDTNGKSDIFVHDRQTGVTTRVSVASNGAQGNGDSSYFSTPSISADGRYVAFYSNSTNLVAGDTNGKSDIFVHNRQTGLTTRVSVASNGLEGDDSVGSWISISRDGRYVAFNSNATNLVAGDTNGAADVFVHDRQTGITARVSGASNGAQGDQGSYVSSISSDGRYVAFNSNATNLVAGDTNGAADVFVHDRQEGITTKVSVASNGAQGNGISALPSISADGRYVAFYSYATNLVAGDTNGVQDIFVHDRHTGVTTRVSVDSNGIQGDAWSYSQSISADGRYVAFRSGATNLVTGDTNGVEDIFVHDRQTGVTTRASVNSYGTQGNDWSYGPSISADGCYTAFYSNATNLIAGDTNGNLDVFVYLSQNDECLNYDIPLGLNWNLISLPVQPLDTSIDTVLATVSGQYNIVWAYEGGEWMMNNPSTPSFNTLDTMEAGRGYWIYMTVPGTLTVSESDPYNSVQLASGWNLVGYNSKTAQPIEYVLASIDEKYISVWAFINGSWQFYAPGNIFNTLETMEPGYGYWINASEACTWTLP